MPIHVTTSTTQSLSNKTFVDRLSTTGVVYADSGNSNQWSSAYSSVYATSASWAAQTLSFDENTAILSILNNGNFVSLSALSSSGGGGGGGITVETDPVFTTWAQANSAKYESTYNTFYTNSGSWDYQGSDIKALTANWQNTYTTVSSYSASWGVGGGTDSQSLSFNENNDLLSISNGNIVSLSALSNTEHITRTGGTYITSSPTTSAVSPLSTTVAPYEKVLIEVVGVRTTGAAGEGMNVTFTGPSDSIHSRFFMESWTSTTVSRVTSPVNGFGTIALEGAGSTATLPFRVTCIAQMGASGGTIQFQVGCEFLGAGAVTLFSPIFMRVHRIP